MHVWSKARVGRGAIATLLSVSAAAMLTVAFHATAIAQTRYTVTVIPPANKTFGNHAAGNAINATGDIAADDTFDATGTHGALIKAGKETELTEDPGQQNETTPFTNTHALALNANDLVVGWGLRGTVAQSGDVTRRPLVWQRGKTLGVDSGIFPLCLDVEAQAINSANTVAGFAEQCPQGAVAWIMPASGGTPQSLGTLGGQNAASFGINDLGQVVGDSDVDAAGTIVHAFVWQSGKGMTDLGVLAGGEFSVAVAINKNGLAAGVSTFAGGNFDLGDRHAVAFQNGSVTDLTPDLPSGFDSFVGGLNNNGQIVGGQLGHAFIWQNGVLTDLNTLIPAASGITLQAANAINDTGHILATGTSSTTTFRGSQIFLLTPN